MGDGGGLGGGTARREREDGAGPAMSLRRPLCLFPFDLRRHYRSDTTASGWVSVEADEDGGEPDSREVVLQRAHGGRMVMSRRVRVMVG